MANIISIDQVSEKSFLQMSNGGTSVLISLLALAASRNAVSEKEKLMATCIASKDQAVFGRGAVGFDIGELPWSKEEIRFNEEKVFLTKSIERVISQVDWDTLDYNPDIEQALSNQHKLLSLVNSFKLEHVQKFDSKNFCLPEKLGEQCVKHQVYLHGCGCVICNDG
jgi:hypothetical protein